MKQDSQVGLILRYDRYEGRVRNKELENCMNIGGGLTLECRAQGVLCDIELLVQRVGWGGRRGLMLLTVELSNTVTQNSATILWGSYLDET